MLPVGALDDGYGRFVTPLGLPLVGGAFTFGIGMQLAGACGSGCLVATGQGSRRIWVALPLFCLGGVAGTVLVPAAFRLPSLGAIDLPEMPGPWLGLAATEALLLVLALAVLRGARPPRGRMLAAAIIGGLAGCVFLASGSPWGITYGLTLWGTKALSAAGLDLSRLEFWADPGARQLLDGPVFALHGALTDAAILVGALLAAALRGTLRHARPLPWPDLAQAALGGLLMGIGARLSTGCNIGAFVGGAASGSLHGIVWLAAAIAGSVPGLRLRTRLTPP